MDPKPYFLQHVVVGMWREKRRTEKGESEGDREEGAGGRGGVGGGTKGEEAAEMSFPTIRKLLPPFPADSPPLQ